MIDLTTTQARGLLAALILVLAACNSTTPSAGRADATPPTSQASPTVVSSTAPSASDPAVPSLTPVPGAASPTPAGATPVSTTVTEWGVIIDGLPSGFPVYPDATPAEPIDGPASAAFSVPASGETTTDWYQSALEMAGYSTFSLAGPFDDGSTVIESVGPSSTDCLVQTTIRPLSGTTHVTILVGVACAS